MWAVIEIDTCPYYGDTTIQAVHGPFLSEEVAKVFEDKATASKNHTITYYVFKMEAGR